MKMEGAYTFAAPPRLLWSLLRSPDALAQVLPGCQRLDQIKPNVYDAALHLETGPLQGQFHGLVKLSEIEEVEGFTIQMEGVGPEGPLHGHGRLTLEPHGDQTVVHYAGVFAMESALAEHSPRLLQTTANALIRRFMQALERAVKSQTRIHTTSLHAAAHAQPAQRRKGSATIDIQDRVQELRRNRRVIAIIIVALVVMLFMAVGALIVLRAALRWGLRYLGRRYAAEIESEEQESTVS